MSHATKIDTVSNPGVSSSHEMLDLMKKEKVESDRSFQETGKTRRGKKTELMPTSTKVVELQEYYVKETTTPAKAPATPATPAAPANPQDDPVNGTSIYFEMAKLFVNNLMQTNQLEITADAAALQANQNSMELVQDGFAKMNGVITADPTADKTKSDVQTCLGYILGAAAIVGGIACLVSGVGSGAGVALIALGVGGLAMGSLSLANEFGKPGLIPWLTNGLNTDPAAYLANQTQSNRLNEFATVANNNTSKNMQTLNNVNSLQQQYSSMFAGMMSNFANSMASR